MTTSVREILDTFDRLSQPERAAILSELLRRTSDIELPFADDDLALAADGLFQELDARESADAKS